MLPICMVNAETLAQVPEDVRAYLRALRRRIIELERTDPQRRIAELEAGNRGLQVQLDDAQALLAQQQEQIHQLQQLLPVSILGPLSRQTPAAPKSWPAPQQTRRAAGPPPPPAPVGSRGS